MKVAFGIKGGESVREGVLRSVPVLVRPLTKKVYPGATLTAVKSIPAVNRYLLQRNQITIAAPPVGIPLATALNFWTTRLARRLARQVSRNDARVIELAERL